MEGALLWLVCWARRASIRYFYPALAALVSSVQSIVFFAIHYFNFYVHIAQLPDHLSVQGL
jgi:hypothetical protein